MGQGLDLGHIVIQGAIEAGLELSAGAQLEAGLRGHLARGATTHTDQVLNSAKAVLSPISQEESVKVSPLRAWY